MNIRFTSSLTPDDENRIAPLIVQAVAAVLTLLPIAFVIRIDTSDSKVYQASGSGMATAAPIAGVPAAYTHDWPLRPEETV